MQICFLLYHGLAIKLQKKVNTKVFQFITMIYEWTKMTKNSTFHLLPIHNILRLLNA
jgi:hypothetical protein